MGRRTDGRWSRKILYWRPQLGGRSRGHPHQRWSDDIDNFFKEHYDLDPGGWLSFCEDTEESRTTWRELGDEFLHTMV